VVWYDYVTLQPRSHSAGGTHVKSENRKTAATSTHAALSEELYACIDPREIRKMERLHRFALLVAYQFTLLAGILLLPVAMVTERLGFRPPVDRLVTGLKQRYERTTAN